MAEATRQAAKPMGRVKKSPQELAEYFYNQRTLNIICFFTSLGMLVCFVAMVWKDYDRPWKDYQRAHLSVDLALVRLKIQMLERDLASQSGEIGDLERRLAAEEDKLLADADYQAALEWVKENTGEHYLLNMEFKFADSEQKAARSAYDLAKEHYEAALNPQSPWHGELPEIEKHKNETLAHLREWDETLQKARNAWDKIDMEMRARVALVEGREADREAIKDELKKRRDEKEKLQARLDKEHPHLATAIRNAPMLDFFGPQFKIKQVVLPDVKEDINFDTYIDKVDRCQTCHLGIGDPAWAVEKSIGERGEDLYHFVDPIRRKLAEPAWKGDAPELKDELVVAFLDSDEAATIRKTYFADGDAQQKHTKAFMTHPYPDLYVTSNSPHPVERFGCTVCHQGDGRDTDFSRVVHTPEDEAETRAWERRYGYHHRELWDSPMYPSRNVYASCRQCHRETVEFAHPSAAPYNDGMVLFERAGCYGCHKTDTYPVLEKDLPRLPSGAIDESKRARRPGPPLTHIADKASPDWSFNWILDPRRFRPTTRMPHFFGQLNARTVDVRDMGAEDEVIRTAPANEVEDAVVATMTAYLYSISQTRGYAAPPPGDAEKGRYIFEAVGCTACHTTKTAAEYGKETAPPSYRLAEFAPSLGSIGDKVRPAWLFNWLRRPHEYYPDTRMPNLRLSDDEAANLTAYLMGLHDPEWSERRTPAAPQDLIKQLMREIKHKRQPLVEAKAEIEAMSDTERILWLGDRMVANFGCYGCHEIHDPSKGEKEQWTQLEGIGVELTGGQAFGSKFLDRLDFGDTKYDGVHYFGLTLPGADKPIRVHHTRQDWLRHKLLNPRIFDAGKLASKPPDELLRMPNFGFNDHEAGLLTTFVLGFNDREVKGLLERIKQTMDAREAAINRGNRILREQNCRACHRMSASRVEIEYGPAGSPVRGWFIAVVERLPQSAVDDYNEAIENEDREWEWPQPYPAGGITELFQLTQVNDPVTLKTEGAALPERFVPGPAIKGMIPGEGGTVVAELIARKQAAYPGGDPVVVPTLVPPWLRTQGHKTRIEWLHQFLKNPEEIRPNLWRPIAKEGPFKDQTDVHVRMGNFNLTDEEATALAKYFVAIDKTDEYEATPQRDPARVEARMPQMKAAWTMVIGDCGKCHVVAGNPPSDAENMIKWAPDLLNVEQRIRPRWLRAWLTDPLAHYPDTYMTSPMYSPSMAPTIKDQEDLLDALVEAFMNARRVHAEVTKESP